MWKNWREDLECDGSLRDIRVVGTTTLDDWCRLIAALPRGGFSIATAGLVEGAPLEALLEFLPMPADEPAKCIHITAGPGRLLFNCHLWGAEVIDFDLDPKEVQFEQDAQTILEFMQWIGNELQRDVLLVDEGAWDAAPGYVRYVHAEQRFAFPLVG